MKVVIRALLEVEDPQQPDYHGHNRGEPLCRIEADDPAGAFDRQRTSHQKPLAGERRHARERREMVQEREEGRDFHPHPQLLAGAPLTET